MLIQYGCGPIEETAGGGEEGECLSQSIWATQIKYHVVSGLQTTDKYSSPFWRPEVQEQGGQTLVKTLVQVPDCQLLAVPSRCGRASGL